MPGKKKVVFFCFFLVSGLIPGFSEAFWCTGGGPEWTCFAVPLQCRQGNNSQESTFKTLSVLPLCVYVCVHSSLNYPIVLNLIHLWEQK